MFAVENSVGYSLTSRMKHDSTFSNKMDDRGTLPLNTVFDNLGNRVNPLSEHIDGRIFASLSMAVSMRSFSSTCICTTSGIQKRPLWHGQSILVAIQITRPV